MKVMLAIVVALALTTLGQPPHGVAAAPLATTETLMGAWKGHWATESPQARGSAELLLARVPGRDEVVGQFTFVIGAAARSLRYEGRIEDGSVRFALVGDGRIVLMAPATRPGAAQRLQGEWKDDRGALPAARGVMELTRVK